MAQVYELMDEANTDGLFFGIYTMAFACFDLIASVVASTC